MNFACDAINRFISSLEKENQFFFKFVIFLNLHTPASGFGGTVDDFFLNNFFQQLNGSFTELTERKQLFYSLAH